MNKLENRPIKRMLELRLTAMTVMATLTAFTPITANGM